MDTPYILKHLPVVGYAEKNEPQIFATPRPNNCQKKKRRVLISFYAKALSTYSDIPSVTLNITFKIALIIFNLLHEVNFYLIQPSNFKRDKVPNHRQKCGNTMEQNYSGLVVHLSSLRI